LYVVGNDSSVNILLGIVRNASCKSKSITNLKAQQITYPGAVLVSPKGKIVISDPKLNKVFTYNPPVNGSLGAPIAITPLVGSYYGVVIAFNQSATDLWTANPGFNGHPVKVPEYAYPAGGTAVGHLPATDFVEPAGVAVKPPEEP
jgi:hypothetical protein